MSNAKESGKSTVPAIQEDDMSRLIVDQQVNMKKRKISASQASEIPQKVRNTMKQQIESWQHHTDFMLDNLSNIITQLDGDHTQIKETQDKLEQLTGALLCSAAAASAAYKQNLNLLGEFHATFKKRSEEMNVLHTGVLKNCLKKLIRKNLAE